MEEVEGRLVRYLADAPLAVQIAAGGVAGLALVLYVLGWVDERLDAASEELDRARLDAHAAAEIARLEEDVARLRRTVNDLLMLMESET